MKGHEIIPIPVAPGEWVYLRLPSVMSAREYDRLQALLEAMRPALTYDPVPCELGPGYDEREPGGSRPPMMACASMG